MGGGLLNLVAYGNANIILNGNPSKTFFSTTYAKYTNFGLQKFRVDFRGPKVLLINTPSVYYFTLPRWGDLVMDTYFVVTMPHIWSPAYAPAFDFFNVMAPGTLQCQGYEFQWIKNLGSQLISKITISIGGEIIQEYTGQYLYNMVQRDFSAVKKKLFDEMTGNVPEMNDPANFGYNNGNYPSTLSFIPGEAPEPSIRSRKLYIPLNFWYMLSSSAALPLVALKYNQVNIKIECRPIRELFVIRDMNYYLNTYWPFDKTTQQRIRSDISYNGVPYISTMGIVSPLYQMYLFITTKLVFIIGDIPFDPKAQSNWGADPHLICTYAFLDKEERNVFISRKQTYLFRQIHEINQLNSASHGTIQRSGFVSSGLVANWMWFFRRNDVNLRNEWSNYTNWLYDGQIPYGPTTLFKSSLATKANPTPQRILSYAPLCPPQCTRYLGENWSWVLREEPRLGRSSWGHHGMPLLPPYFPYMYSNNSIGVQPMISGPLQTANQRFILKHWSLWCGGKTREGRLDAGVLDTVEKYARSSGGAERGLYFYNFGLTTNPYIEQPTGAMNTTSFNRIFFEYDTINVPRDLSSILLPVCDASENLMGLNMDNWRVSIYDFDLYIMEERYNLLTIENGLPTQAFINTR